MDKNFGGVIWTNHAISRMRERGIKQGDAWAVWKRPDSSRQAQTKGTYVYYKIYDNQTIEVVAKQNDKKEWLILSVWSKPVEGKTNPKFKKGKSLFRLFFEGLLGKIKN